jgi:hypothetical protein
MGKWAVAGKDPRAMLDDLVGAMGRAKTDTDALALAQDAGMGKSSKAMVQAVKDGAFALDSSKQQLEAAKGKTDDLAASTTTLGEEVTKTWHAFSLMGAEIGGPLAGFLADCLRQVRELDASFGKMEKSIIDWVGDSGLMSIIGPAARVVNNALNPWASGNYINNLTTDAPVPSMPKAPRGPVPSDLAYGGVTTNSGVTAPGNAPGDKTRPLSQESDSLAVLIDRYHDAIAAHKATIEEIAKSGLSIPDFWAKQATDATASAVAFDKLGNAVEPQKSIFEALAPTIDKCDKLLKEMGIDTAKSAQEALAASPFGKLADSAQYFGITTAHAYDTAAKTAEAKFDQMLQSGIATNRELAIAALKMGQAEIDADLAAGKISDAYHNKVRAQMDADLAKWTNTEKKKQSLSDQVTAETKRLTTSMFNSMEKGLASDIVHWKGFGATIKSVFQTMGEDVLSILLHALLKPVEKLMGDLLGRLTGDLVTNFAIDKAAASATDVGQVAGAAAVGGAAATASIAAIPIVGPAAAPAAGAAMYAEIMGVYSPLAVFAKGGIAGEDMIAGLRRKEMVLPEDISIPLRAAIKAGSFSGGGGVTVTGNNFYGVSKDTVNQLANQMVRQARLAGAKI